MGEKRWLRLHAIVESAPFVRAHADMKVRMATEMKERRLFIGELLILVSAGGYIGGVV